MKSTKGRFKEISSSGAQEILMPYSSTKWLTKYCGLSVIISNACACYMKLMVGPPRFELGSDGPQPPSIGQTNPRTLLVVFGWNRKGFIGFSALCQMSPPHTHFCVNVRHYSSSEKSLRLV